jgi:ribosomal protein S18 acetylase RimI-like enzyme
VVALVTAEPSEQFLTLVEPELDQVVLTRILTGPSEVAFVELRDPATHELLGTGRASAASSPVGRWAGVTSILVATDARRRGVATRVMHELAAWATAHGCPMLYLQVLASNEEALALYDGLGFTTHHAYCYRSPAPVPPR